ncbi:MAG: DUF58 domain-containing protein [Desulfobulbus propionicus]|nr:MAG: DUF58 domain-containing protein [Desulfobulbus propionicus]
MNIPPAPSPVTISLDWLVGLRAVGARRKTPSRSAAAIRAGEHLSHIRGRGMEFSEVRSYHPGDDIRTIDWRVTARSGKVHTKLFHEERERPVLIAVDYRRQMFFATRGRFKAVLASELAARMAWLALAGSNRVGAFLFSEEERIEVRPSGGRRGVLRLLQQMVSHPAWERELHAPFAPEKRLAATIIRLRRVVQPGTMVILISDFAQWDEEVEQQLALMGRHADICLLFCYDPLEADLPECGHYRISDGRSELTIATADAGLRDRYALQFQEHFATIKDFCRSCRVYLQAVSTSDNPEQVQLPGVHRRAHAVA